MSEQRSGLPLWRRAATIVLLVVAVAFFVLAVSGVASTVAAIGCAAIVALSYIVGPRSPIFRSDPA